MPPMINNTQLITGVMVIRRKTAILTTVVTDTLSLLIGYLLLCYSVHKKKEEEQPLLINQI